MALIIVLLRGIFIPVGGTIIVLFRYLILLSNVIPISMRVNLEFAKLVYSLRINMDEDIPETITRNSQIPEELGRIQFLLTDKTGTLTQNDMIFKKICIDESVSFTCDEIYDIKEIL
jgi:phospholipid-translocating ATPase